METKPGLYTTEFWLAIGTILIQFVNLFDWWNFTADQNSAFLSAFVVIAYAISRGLAKIASPADPTKAGNYKIAPRPKDFV